MGGTDYEIKRLKALGWDEGIQHHGVWWKSTSKAINISFPEEAYEDLDTGSKIVTDVWSVFRATSIMSELTKNDISILWEIGAGSGNVSEFLRSRNIEVICVEPISTGASYLGSLGARTYCGTLEDLALPDNSIRAIGMFDVLEHIENPEQTILEIFRVLENGGIFICTVPAMQFLFSDFDMAIGHYRRFTKKTLKILMKDTGFVQMNLRFIFALLVPVAYITRVIPTKLGRKLSYDQIKTRMKKQLNHLTGVHSIIRLLLKCEKFIGPPFGLSLLGVRKKY